MRAAVLRAYGVPVADSFEEPSPDRDQAVVDVLAAGLNPVDVAICAGRFYAGKPPLPSVAGREGVGRLDGQRVYFDAPVSPFGSMAERALVDPRSTYPVPDGVADGVAVALGISGLAAWLALTWRAQLKEGEHVLVLAASGVLGQIAVQAAKLLGAGRVVAAARSPEGLARCLELGADASVRLDDPDDLSVALAQGGRRPDRRRARPVVGGAAGGSAGRGELRRAHCADRRRGGRGGDDSLGGDSRQDARADGPHELRSAAGGQARGVHAHGRGGCPRRDQGGRRRAWARAGGRGLASSGGWLAPQDRARAVGARARRAAPTGDGKAHASAVGLGPALGLVLEHLAEGILQLSGHALLEQREQRLGGQRSERADARDQLVPALIGLAGLVEGLPQLSKK